MKCFECDDGVIRNVSYVIMQALFSYWKDRELEFQSGGYAVVGFERPSSPVTSGHFLYTSDDYGECAGKLAEYRYQLEHYPDDDPDTGYIVEDCPDGDAGYGGDIRPEPGSDMLPF